MNKGLLIGVSAAVLAWVASELFLKHQAPQGAENAPQSATNTGAVVNVSNSSGYPRGIRNNNPLNIKYNAGNNWKGQIGKDSGGFVVFASPVFGFRAAYKILKSYAAKGTRTLGAVCAKWSPDPVGLSGAYATNVSRLSGFPISGVIPLGDHVTTAKILKAMNAQENGQKYYDFFPLSVIETGILTQ